eukprot:superscaffoldBa00000452_g4830
MYSNPNNTIKPSCDSSSITELLGALCDCSLSGVSWKRRALGGVSREGFRKALKKRAYGALLSKLFQDGTKASVSGPSAMANTPPRNKVLMICFDLRVAGCREEAEKLEEQLERLPEGASSGLKEVDSVLELLVHLAGSSPPPPTSFSRDYMRRERPVLRRPQPWSYQSEELQRLEARAWGLVCGEEWGTLESLCGTQRLMDAPPGTGLLTLRTKMDAEERFEKETRMTLFGALQHTRTSDIDIRLDLPPVPSNIDVTGLAIRVPPCLDQSEDEGFQSSSNLTPDSQSEPSPSPELDLWEALRTFEPGRRRCWESVGCPPGKRESLYLTEGGREAFDKLYRLWEGEIRVVSTSTPSPLLPLPLDSQTQLVSDLLNMLIGVASTTFPLNQSVQFDVRPGVCVSGASAESVSRLLGELAQYGTYYLRLSRFSLQNADKKGLVFQGVKLLSYLYNEAQNNCSNENYPVLLSLLKSSCEPYTRFVSDWVYSGVFRDVYGEFMIQVNEDYLSFRDKHFWVQGYTLISKDVEDCVPIFLRHIANDVYVCGKTINLLKICCPQHYICWSELPMPRIAVTFSLQEVEEIERDCAVYRGRMERIAKHSAISREEQALRTEQARQELINQVRESAAKTLESIRGRQVSQRLAEEAKKRERFEELKQHLEQEQEWRSAAKKKQEEDDFSFARELRDREKRLQALEEQLEQRARKELIAQYSHLSEEAARRERRAMWRVQRMRLDDARAQFFKHDKQQMQETLTQGSSEQQPAEIQEPEAALPPRDPSSPTLTPLAVDPALISEDIDINDFLAKSPNPDSQQVDAALQEIGSDLPEACPTAQLVDYDFSAPFSPLEGITGQASVQPRPRWGPAVQPDLIQNHPSFSHIPIGENMSQIQSSVPKASPFGQASKSSFPLGQYTPEEPKNTSKASVYGHPSQASVQLVDGSGSMTDNKQEKVAPVPEQETEIGILESSAYGHSSDSTLGVGCVVSGMEPQHSVPRGSAYGHSSDSSLGVGCVVKGKGRGDQQKTEDNEESKGSKSESPGEQLAEAMGSWAASFGLSPGEKSEQEYLFALSCQYQVEHYEDCYNVMASSPECQLLKQVTRGPWGLPMDPTLRTATDTTPVQLSEMVSLPVLIKNSVTTPLITHVSLVNKAVVDYFFVELGVERHFEALRHFLLMEDGEFAQSLSDLLFEKLGSGQTPGELLTPLVLNSILSKALQYSLHGDTPLAGNFTFALRFLPETFHPHAPDSLNCLELRYKVDWPLNIIITDSCMNKYNRLFSFLLQLKHMVWSLRDVWFHLKRTDYLNRAIFRGLLTEKAAPVMNIIHSIFSLILKFRAQLIAQPWDSHQGEAVHPSFIAMQQSYNTFKYYSHFLFKVRFRCWRKERINKVSFFLFSVVTKLVNRGYQPHLEDFLLRINFNNYYKDS